MKTIWVGGDFFRDEFNTGNMRGDQPRFDVQDRIITAGGALNAFENAKHLASAINEINVRTLGGEEATSAMLRRWISDDELVFEAWTRDTWQDKDHPWQWWKNHHRFCGAPEHFTTLLVSEYDKGSLNGTFAVPSWPQVDLLVLDSRYRTVDPAVMALAKTRIWRCTGEEFNTEWANHFDWIVWTNHNDRIQIFPTREEGEAWLEVPSVEVVDPIGAGDTFSAALAVYLTHVEEVNWKTMVSACQFAIKAAQDVCKKKFTAITEVILEG